MHCSPLLGLDPNDGGGLASGERRPPEPIGVATAAQSQLQTRERKTEVRAVIRAKFGLRLPLGEAEEEKASPAASNGMATLFQGISQTR
jgi:hypothetical protein